MPAWTFTRSRLTNPKHLQRVRLTSRSDLSPGVNPFNLATRWGEYYVSFARSGDAMVEYTSWAAPPWQFAVHATDTHDVSEPRVAVTTRRRTWLIYTRTGPKVYQKPSDDDARTWGTEELLWNPGSHPDISAGADGAVLRAAYAGGQIAATWTGPGDATPSRSFTLSDGTAPLSVEDDSFRLVQDARRWWWLHVRIAGDGKTSLWASFDDAETWQRIADGVTGGTRPSIAGGPDGALLAWAYLAGTIRFLYRAAGDTGFSLPAAVKDAAGANLASADDTASFAQAREHPRRWLLAVQIAGSGVISDHYSSDDGATVKEFA